jgi:hypothetical protein
LPQEQPLGGPAKPESASSRLRGTIASQSQTRASEPEQRATEAFVAPPTPAVSAEDTTEAAVSQAHDEGQRASVEPTCSSESLSHEPARAAATGRESREIETSFGGVFYLVNLGLFLGFYGDFTNPLRPGISLSLWDFVALAGRELVGKELEDDPVWMLLAELAGRADGEEPGKGFAPPDQTLESVSDALISHPFALSLSHDGRRSALTVRQEEYEKADSDDAPLRRWLGLLMPELRARLQRALGLAAHEGLGALLCHHRARVTTTTTHLDAYLSLAELPIVIRLAGLDRDPGWVPAAGRSIAFHFD